MVFIFLFWAIGLGAIALHQKKIALLCWAASLIGSGIILFIHITQQLPIQL